MKYIIDGMGNVIRKGNQLLPIIENGEIAVTTDRDLNNLSEYKYAAGEFTKKSNQETAQEEKSRKDYITHRVQEQQQLLVELKGLVELGEREEISAPEVYKLIKKLGLLQGLIS
jgi:hypothetical protein